MLKGRHLFKSNKDTECCVNKTLRREGKDEKGPDKETEREQREEKEKGTEEQTSEAKSRARQNKKARDNWTSGKRERTV